ncbi:MAG TPA: ankyrin repeat domain-containing protein [Gemmatimonadota bacterium]|nr:ankyrin repeat domain-containing protein [Gemmatimonadota bacterium]
MKPGDLDALFRQAVSAIDAGDGVALDALLASHPELVRERLESPGAWLREQVGDALDGFFERPWLLWFVAEDPVRNGRLPGNIAALARAIVDAARREGVPGLQEQLDSTLRLVSWSWIARECGVQIALIDVLVDAGAALDENPDNALVNGNREAAAHMIDRGARLTLGTALCLERWEDVGRLVEDAGDREKQFALVLAALNGGAEALRRILPLGVALNAPSPDLFSHATALHHAVWSGSLDAVRVLVDAGADLGAKDEVWKGTPLNWAEHSENEEIKTYLRGKQ